MRLVETDERRIPVHTDLGFFSKDPLFPRKRISLLGNFASSAHTATALRSNPGNHHPSCTLRLHVTWAYRSDLRGAQALWIRLTGLPALQHLLSFQRCKTELHCISTDRSSNLGDFGSNPFVGFLKIQSCRKMAVANRALSCHHYGALINGAGSPRTSNFKRTVLSPTTGLLALSRNLSHKKRNLIKVFSTASAGNALLEASTVSIDVKGGLDEREMALEAEMQGLLHDSKFEMVLLREEESRQASLQGMGHVSNSKKGWWTLGVAMAGCFESLPMHHANAAEDLVMTAATETATKTAPAWVAPSVLAFPVVSYVLFTFYRNNVNPYAKLTDWLFGLVAMAILGNLILIATVGVRLY